MKEKGYLAVFYSNMFIKPAKLTENLHPYSVSFPTNCCTSFPDYCFTTSQLFAKMKTVPANPKIRRMFL